MLTPENIQVSDHQSVNLGQARIAEPHRQQKVLYNAVIKKHMEKEHETNIE